MTKIEKKFRVKVYDEYGMKQKTRYFNSLKQANKYAKEQEAINNQDVYVEKGRGRFLNGYTDWY